MIKSYRLHWSSGALALMGLVVAGCAPAVVSESTKAAPRVTVAHPVVRDLVDEDDYNGWLAAHETLEVRSRVRGHIQKIHFKDGDIVKKGQLLFELDPRPFQIEINQAMANAKALEAQKAASEKDVARYTELLKSGGASRQQLEKAQADALAYDAQIAAKMEEVKRYQLDLQYSKITADLGGRIGKANLTEGNLVNAGGSDPLLTTIVSIDPIYVDFNVDERAMQHYQEMGDSQKSKDRQQSLRNQKMPFSFGLDTEKGFPHEGLLVFADNKYTEGTGTILVRGVADNSNGKLIPGSRVRVRIPVSDKYPAIVVPDTAVLSDQDRKYLLVLGKDDIVLRREVTLGRLLDDGMRVILPESGEKQAAGNKDWVKKWEKEQVITIGLQRARIDYPVQPLDSNGQPVKTTPTAQ
jgi:RND family efflux transporter MFP subunit